MNLERLQRQLEDRYGMRFCSIESMCFYSFTNQIKFNIQKDSTEIEVTLTEIKTIDDIYKKLDEIFVREPLNSNETY